MKYAACVAECCVMRASTFTKPEPAETKARPTAPIRADVPLELAHQLGLAVVAKALGLDYELRLPAFVTCDFDQNLPMAPVLG